MSDKAFYDELLNPHCGNQALHLAEYCLVTLRTFEVVAENTTDVTLTVNADILETSALELTGLCLRMLVIACNGNRELASLALSDAMLTGRTLHESVSDHMPQNLN